MLVHPDPTLVRSRLSFALAQAGIVVLGLFIYFRVRGLTESSADVARDHAHDIVALEQRLGINVEATLQSWVAPSEFLETIANWIYIWGHWPVIVATMLWLVWHHRAVFLRLRDAMLVSGALGMAVFVSYPVAPPRLADLGLIDTVTENSQAYRVLQPPAFVNQYAAMPSLHSGWDLLVGMAIVTAASSVVLKVVGYAMPILMAVAVVATANHYILDVVAGVALVLFGHFVALRLERYRARHRTRGS
jgi:membrane-associated phospholipid phosphatase